MTVRGYPSFLLMGLLSQPIYSVSSTTKATTMPRSSLMER